MMMKYNERKYLVLDAVDDLGEATAYEVWEEQEDDVSLSAIQMALLRYHKQGLLNRWGYPKVYSLSERGEERLEWLESLDTEEEA